MGAPNIDLEFDRVRAGTCRVFNQRLGVIDAVVGGPGLEHDENGRPVADFVSAELDARALERCSHFTALCPWQTG